MFEIKKITRAFTIDGFCTAFAFDWDDKFIFSGENHGFWEAVFVSQGEVEVTENENVYLLGANDLIFHAPMEFHRIKSAADSSPQGFIISFTATGDLPSSIRSGVFYLDPTSAAEYCAICRKAIDFLLGNASDRSGQELGDLLSAFIIRLGGERSSSEKASLSQSASEYRRIVSYMNEKVCDNLTLTDVALSNSLSISYIKLLFRTYAGISPKNYYNQLRVRYATELLRFGSSTTEVSNRMNFSSPNYFSAFYKKHTGISPSSRQKATCPI